MRKKKNVFLIIMLSLFLSILGSAVYVNSLLNHIDRTADTIIASDPGVSAEVKIKRVKNPYKVINIALFGIDYETGDKGRTDAILIFTIDRPHNTVKMTSIMRDSYVNISGYGKDKINHAYVFGGPQLAIKTLNENFNLTITKYVAVNFSDFSAIIDELGGIEIKVSDEEASQIPRLEKGGTYELTGDQALAYSRIRCLSGGDYERTFRQRVLLEKLYSMLANRPITQYSEMAEEFLPMIHTNLTNREIMIYSAYIAASRPKLVQTRFPKDDMTSSQRINGVYYLVFQEQETIEAIHRFIFGPVS
jgi:LCP family protein required for cell wall assembly